MTPPISGFLPGEEEQRMERYRRMPPGEKFAEMAALTRAEDERRRADIRARYGNVSKEEMRIRLGMVRLGRAMVTKVLGRDPESALEEAAVARTSSRSG